MIKVTLLGLVILVIGGAVLVNAALWLSLIFQRRRSSLFPGEASCARHCPYCASIVVDYSRREYIRCPVCDSYLEGGNNVKKIE